MSRVGEQALVDAIVSLLQYNEVVVRMFDEYGASSCSIVDVPIGFGGLGVSAKTEDGKITLDRDLLEDGDFQDNIHYIVHELTHWLQQVYGKPNDENSEHYLDMPDEIEAFRNQYEFIRGTAGKSRANKYINDLLDFHEFSGKERELKFSELTEV